MDILQSFEATEEVPAKVNKQVDDPPCETCNVTPYTDRLARSKSLVHDSSKREQRNLGNSFSGDLGPRNSNSSHCADHDVELLQLIPMTNEVSMVTDAGMSILQSERIERSRSTAQRNRFKAKHPGSIEFSSADLESRHTISLLQCDDEKESLKPSTANGEGLLVENITSDNQLEEKAECADTNRFSIAGRVSQTCISRDGTTFVGVNHDSISKAELSGYVESSSVAWQSRHSVLPSGDETLFLKPITVTDEALVVEKDKNGESSDISSLSISRNVTPTDISVVEQKVIVEFILQESGTPKDLIDHTNRCDISSGSKELQPHDSCTKGGSKQCNAKISWPRSSTKEEESAKEYKALPVDSEEVKARSSTSRTLHDSPVFMNPESPRFDDNEEGNFEEMMNSGEESIMEKAPTPVSAATVFDVPSLTDPEGNFSADNAMNDIKAHNCLKEETVAERESPAGHTGVKAIDNEPPESNALSVHIDALTNSLKRRVSLLLPNTSSNISVALQTPGKSTLSDVSQESLLSYRPYLSAETEGDVFFQKNMSQLDILKYAESEATERSQDKTISEDQEKEREVEPSVVKWNPGNSCGCSVTPATEKISTALDDRLSDGSVQRQTKRPQLKISSEKGFPPIDRGIGCTETGVSHGPESSIQEFFCSSSSMGSSHQQNKRRKTLDELPSGLPSSSPGGNVLDSGSVRETVHHREEAAYRNLEHHDVELQKMIGSASSAELRLEESYLLKEAGMRIPASLSFRPEQLSIQRSQIATDLMANSFVRDSVDSPCLPPLGLIGSDSGSPPVLEKFIIQTDDKNQSSSRDQITHDIFQYSRTVENATMVEQLCKSACITTPLLHLPNTSKSNSKLDLDQSVSTGLLGGMFFSQNLESNFVFDDFGIGHTGSLYTDSLPVSEAGSSADTRNPCTSPTEKLFWYRSLQKSSSSEKRGSRTPDLPCISEENENVYEEAEDLSTHTPKSTSSEKRGTSIQDLPCIAEENENIDETSEAVNEAKDSKMKNVSAERKPLGDINENPMKLLPSVSEAKIPVDRQSLDSVNAAFSFTATCNTVKSKTKKHNGGNRRFTGKGKENQDGPSAARNVKPPSSRFSKPKLSCNSSLTTLGPRLSEIEPRQNNIVSNVTSFVPLVQQQKPAAGLITGKRDVKVKALEAAEAAKRMAEQKENDRKMKKEAMKLERARQEQENLRKQEMEKKKKEEDRKKKEAEMASKQEMEKKKREEERKKKEAELACKQELEKKKKEDERKKKEAEMADRKRQREEDDKKLKEAKRKRVAEAQKQQREAEQKLQAEKIENELKTQAMEARIKAQKEHREGQNNAEKIALGQANSRMPEVRSKIPGASKSNASDDTNVSRNSNDDSKVTSNPGKVSDEANTGIEAVEESYDISPYKCSDDEEDEEEDDYNISNNKFVPAWASKSCVLIAVSSQQNLDPDSIFPLKSFCGISQVLLPRKLQSKS